MPSGSTRVSYVLSNIALKYMNEEYIAGKILKDVPVAKESDSYWIYANDFRLEDSNRANGAMSNRITMGYSTASYQVQVHALSDVITDRDRENTDAPLNLDRDMTENLVDKILMRQEYEVMKTIFTTGAWGNNATLTSETSWKYHTTTSAPIQNVLSATGKIIQASGKMPNKMIMGWATYEALKENQNVYDRIKYSERGIITPEILASIFDIQELLVGKSVYDSTKEGETESKGFLWGSDCLIGYFDPAPGIRKVSAAINFKIQSSGNPYTVKKWREEPVEGDVIEVQTKFCPKLLATSCAYFFKSCAL